MPWNLKTDGDSVLVVRERDKKVVGRHKNRKKALAQLRVLYSLEKASFGGDRSEAGRYAANIRWQGHVEDESGGRTPAQQELLNDFRNSQNKIPRSPKNPEGLNPQAVRSWVDGPFPKSGRNFPINDYMRHIANSLLGLPLNTYRKLPTSKPRKGDRVGRGVDGRIITNQVKNLLESIDKAPPEQPTLWRGLRGGYGSETASEEQIETAKQLLAIREGDTLKIPFMSTSRDKGIASLLYGLHLIEKGDPPSVIMRIEKGAKGISTNIIPNDHEVLTSGKFVVTAKTETTVEHKSLGATYNHPVVLISVKQVDTFKPKDYKNPNFYPFSSHSDYEISKASFGGDRSEAGRYAANVRWQEHQKKNQVARDVNIQPTATLGVRTTEEKLVDGPQNLVFDRDENGMPKMGSLDELKKRYGRGASARSEYFLKKYGVKVKIKPVKADSLDEITQLGALQAVEDVLMNTQNHHLIVKDIMLGDDGSLTYGEFDANGYYQEGYITLKQETIKERLLKTIPRWMSNERDITENLSFRFTQQGVPVQRDNVQGLLRTMCQRAGYAIMVHEFGHAIDMGAIGRSSASSSKHYEQDFTRGGAKLPKSVSTYGYKNEFEYVAEAWTAWFLFGQSSVRTGFSEKSYGELATPILRPIFEDRKDVVKMVGKSIDIAKLPRDHPVVLFTIAPFVLSVDLIKASFGGDRSEAGRYAANIRWQGHSKERTREEIVSKGPQNFIFGRDELGLPKMGSLAELKKRYGKSAQARQDYFFNKYLVQTKIEPTKAGSKAEAAQLGALQALEELMRNTVGHSLLKKVSIGNDESYYYSTTQASGFFGDDENGAGTITIHPPNIVAQAETVSEMLQLATSPVYSASNNIGGVFSDDVYRFDLPQEAKFSLDKISQRLGYATMIHEFGHAIDIPKGRTNAISSRFSDEMMQPSNAVSRYGQTNNLEFTAEGFSAWFLFSGVADKIGSSKPSAKQEFLLSRATRGSKIVDAIINERQGVLKNSPISTTLQDLPFDHPIILFAFLPFMRLIPAKNSVTSLVDLIKASFGGDRSEAGRYAANIRWQGHSKREPVSSPPSGGAADFMRLMNGTPQNYTVKGVILVHSWGTEGNENGQYSFLLNHDPTDELSSSAVWHTTVGEFRRMALSGELDLSPSWKEHVLSNLRVRGEEDWVDMPDDMRVAVELGVGAVVVREQPLIQVRPDEPHTPQDIKTLGSDWHSSAHLEEDDGLLNETERVLSVNTSPKNKGPVKSGTISRWEKAWETEDSNMPYCREIAGYAAYLMGQIDVPRERERGYGFRGPSEAMLEQDSKDLLASVNKGVEGQPVLWRGLDTQKSDAKKAVNNAEVGDTMTLGLASTSRDLLSAAKYTPSYAEGVPLVMMRIEEGSKGVSIGDRALYRHDQEVITSGKFEVTEIQEVTVPRWRFPMPSMGGLARTIAPSKEVALERDAAPRLKRLLPSEQYASIERYLQRQEKKAAEYEKETITVKIVSVRQTETFNPETKEFEANG